MRTKPFCNTAFSVLLGLASVQAVDRLQAQQVKYTPKEYEAFTKAIQEPDLGKRANGIVSCMKEYPKSELTEYAVSNYLQVMQQYRSKGQPRQVASAGEKLLTLQPGNLHALFWTAEAFFQTREFAKAARYGEKAYAAKNDSGLAFVLASSYLELKDDRRLLLYGEKACAKLAPKDCYQILGELTRILAANEQWSKAASYAKKSIEGFEAAKKPAQTPQKEWNDYVNRQKAVAYAVLGRHAAENRKWRTARSNYQKALGESSNPGLKGEAYYYIGLGHWRGNRIDPAMEAFAKGAVQRGAPHARHCRRSLEKLYKSTHNDSLAGIDEFIQRVGR